MMTKLNLEDFKIEEAAEEVTALGKPYIFAAELDRLLRIRLNQHC
jgi:hypothetical protein